MIEILLLPVAGLIVLQVILFLFVPKQQEHRPSAEELRRLKLVRGCGVSILAAGLVAAGWVYGHTQPSTGETADIIGYETAYGNAIPIHSGMSKKSAVQEERMGGKFGVMLEKVMPWFLDQWHGRKLAATVLVISGAIFLGCLGWARIMTFPPG